MGELIVDRFDELESVLVAAISLVEVLWIDQADEFVLSRKLLRLLGLEFVYCLHDSGAEHMASVGRACVGVKGV